MTANKVPGVVYRFFVRDKRGVRREQVTYKETCYHVTDTNLENDITSEISIVCLANALLSLIKHGRLVSAAIDLPRPYKCLVTDRSFMIHVPPIQTVYLDVMLNRTPIVLFSIPGNWVIRCSKEFSDRGTMSFQFRIMSLSSYHR